MMSELASSKLASRCALCMFCRVPWQTLIKLDVMQAEERKQSKASKGERPVVSKDNPVWQAIRRALSICPPDLCTHPSWAKAAWQALESMTHLRLSTLLHT